MHNLIRWILPVLLGANGLAMLLFAAQWYPAVPGVTETGPFNSHFVRDIGSAYLACAVGLGWWAARRPGGAGAALVAAVFLGLHMLVHVADAMSGHHPGGDIVRDFVGVYVPALATIWIAWRSLKRGEA